MGSFNTKGFLSQVDLEYNDRAFILVCSQYHSPLKLKVNDSVNFNSSSGAIYPLTFPIFGKYDDYGRLCEIEHDFNTDQIELKINDTIENFIDVLYNVTVFPHNLSEDQINKYESYKKALFNDEMNSFENLKELYNKHKHIRDCFSTLEDWIDNCNKIHSSNNKELIWTMDHSFIYDTCGGLYNNYINVVYDTNKEYIFGSLNTLWSEFGKFWNKDNASEDLYITHRSDICKYLSFAHFMFINKLEITHSYPTCQDVDWLELQRYTESINNFVKSKIIKYY